MHDVDRSILGAQIGLFETQREASGPETRRERQAAGGKGETRGACAARLLDDRESGAALGERLQNAHALVGEPDFEAAEEIALPRREHPICNHNHSHKSILRRSVEPHAALDYSDKADAEATNSRRKATSGARAGAESLDDCQAAIQ